MALLDEDLTPANDADFSDLFISDDIDTSSLSETVTVVGEDESSVPVEPAVVEQPKKRRGRPPKKETVAEAVEKKRRGRPAKKADENPAAEVEAETTESVVEEGHSKKTRAKRVSVDDFPPEVLNAVFEGFSKRPISELSEELKLQERHIHKIMSKLNELFVMNISTGDLTQEDYDKYIAPKMVEFKKPKSGFEQFVHNKLSSFVTATAKH